MEYDSQMDCAGVTHAPDRSAELGASSVFGADCLLLSALVLSFGIPLYHMLGIPSDPLVRVLYALSAALLPCLSPLAVWYLRRGREHMGEARRIALHAAAYVPLVLFAVAAAVQTENAGLLVGISVMAFVGAVLVGTVGGRFADERTPSRLRAVRITAIVLTPTVVLGLTQYLPDGLAAIGGWSIPMPVSLAAAIGAARGMMRRPSGAAPRES